MFTRSVNLIPPSYYTSTIRQPNFILVVSKNFKHSYRRSKSNSNSGRLESKGVKASSLLNQIPRIRQNGHNAALDWLPSIVGGGKYGKSGAYTGRLLIFLAPIYGTRLSSPRNRYV